MDNFTQIANKILTEHTFILKENQLAELSPRVGQSFGDFLRSLTGKTRKDILDAASYARLYAGNKFGMTSAANDESNPEVLLSNFLTKLGNFINKDVVEHRPRIAETEEFKKKYGYNEYLEQEKERRQLFIDLIKAKEGPEKDALRRKKNAFRNTSEYAEAARLQNKKEDAAVEKFHNTPIEPGDIVNDGSEEFMKLQDLYNTIQGNQHVNIDVDEDQESGPQIRPLDGFFSDKKPAIEDAEQSIDSVAKTAAAVLSIPDQGKGKFIPGSVASKVQKAKKELADKLIAAARSVKI